MTTATTREWKFLSEILDDVRPALRAIDLDALPRSIPSSKDVNGAAYLCCLRNDHLGPDRLILPELPADASIPHRYESNVVWSTLGMWKPFPDAAPTEVQMERAIGDRAILREYATCALYGNP